MTAEHSSPLQPPSRQKAFPGSTALERQPDSIEGIEAAGIPSITPEAAPDLSYLIPEIDEAITLTEQELARQEADSHGITYMLPTYIRALGILKERIRDNSLSREQREQCFSSLGRGLLENEQFAYSPIGLKINDIARRFAELPEFNDEAAWRALRISRRAG